MSERNIPFSFFFSHQSQVYHLGSNHNNRRADLDTAFKKLTPLEQRLTYQSCYVCILVKGKLSVKSNHCKPNKDGTCITDKISQ